MKKIFSKKKLLGFAPELHWDIMLMIIAIIVIWISISFSYTYVTLNKHIENVTTLSASTVNKEETSLKKIVNMEGIIAKYRAKEDMYNGLIAGLTKRTPVPVATTTATSTATSSVKSVATSTVR